MPPELKWRNHTARDLSRPTRGHQVAAVAQAKRAPLMPWQRYAADVTHELSPDPETGRMVLHYSIVVLTIQRQAGKTKLESDVADARCLSLPRARCWITMQNGKTVDEWMREEHFTNLRGASVFGIPGTKSARYTQSKRAGATGVRWKASASTFTTFAPTIDALHSKQADLVVVDEAWVHDAIKGAELRQAIRPTMNTRPGAQLWIVSTLGTDESAYLDDYIAMARASLGNPNARVCFIDYGIPDDADPMDLDVIREWHPAYGHTLTDAALLAAFDEFMTPGSDRPPDPDGWARAYGNRATRRAVSAFGPGIWTTAGRPQVARPERAGIAVDATPAGDRVAISAGWRDAAGHGFAELLYSDPSARDTPAIAAELARRNGNQLTATRDSVGVLELLDAVQRLEPTLTIRLRSATEFGSDCGVFARGIKDGTMHHFNDPDLDSAVEVAGQGPSGDGGFRWVRKDSSGSIAELVAATLAVGAFDALPAPKRAPVAYA